MKVIKNRLIPFGKHYKAINLLGMIFVKGDYDSRLLNHEAIHTAQQKDYCYIGFYILYIFEWLRHLFRLRDFRSAYHAISFEREAYANEADPGYLVRRRPFSHKKYKTP